MVLEVTRKDVRIVWSLSLGVEGNQKLLLGGAQRQRENVRGLGLDIEGSCVLRHCFPHRYLTRRHSKRHAHVLLRKLTETPGYRYIPEVLRFHLEVDLKNMYIRDDDDIQ